jgi:hypothetical protein
LHYVTHQTKRQQMINELDINSLYKQVEQLIEKIPAKNLVLRQQALDDLKKSRHSCLLFWAHQNNISQLEGDAPETEEQRIERIVAPYITINAAGKKTLFGNPFPADVPMGAKKAALQRIVEIEAQKQMGIQQTAQGGEEVKKTEAAATVTAKTPDAAPLPSTSNEAESFTTRSIEELFANTTIINSVFGEQLLGNDKGATTIAQIDKALAETLQNTTSADSLARGGNALEAHIAICIAFILRQIDESEINLAQSTGFTAAGKGRKPADLDGLSRRAVIDRILRVLRPDLVEKAEEKKAAKKEKP